MKSVVFSGALLKIPDDNNSITTLLYQWQLYWPWIACTNYYKAAKKWAISVTSWPILHDHIMKTSNQRCTSLVFQVIFVIAVIGFFIGHEHYTSRQIKNINTFLCVFGSFVKIFILSSRKLANNLVTHNFYLNL